jgi:hypothetical protein
MKFLSGSFGVEALAGSLTQKPWSRGFSRFSDPKTRLKALLQTSKTFLETDRIVEGAKNRVSTERFEYVRIHLQVKSMPDRYYEEKHFIEDIRNSI